MTFELSKTRVHDMSHDGIRPIAQVLPQLSSEPSTFDSKAGLNKSVLGLFRLAEPGTCPDSAPNAIRAPACLDSASRYVPVPRKLCLLQSFPETCFHLCCFALLLAATGGLHGCAGVVVGGAATGVAVAADSRTTGTIIEDQAIEVKAAKAILEEEELRQKTHVNVTSYNMIVLVTGEAPTEELRNRVIDLVRHIEKVRHVYDELTVAAPSSMLSRSSDGVITAKVKTKLLGLKDFDGTRVKVVTENGIVYLMGLVGEADGERAAAAARTVGGVQKVVKLFESAPT